MPDSTPAPPGHGGHGPACGVSSLLGGAGGGARTRDRRGGLRGKRRNRGSTERRGAGVVDPHGRTAQSGQRCQKTRCGAHRSLRDCSLSGGHRAPLYCRRVAPGPGIGMLSRNGSMGKWVVCACLGWSSPSSRETGMIGTVSAISPNEPDRSPADAVSGVNARPRDREGSTSRGGVLPPEK